MVVGLEQVRVALAGVTFTPVGGLVLADNESVCVPVQPFGAVARTE
jgi:hypothetical protein